MDRATILIVEDETIVAKGIQRILGKEGYQAPTTVSSAEDAVRSAESTHPDLVLMDIELEGNMSGIEAAEHIRLHLDIPVVYLTAFADQETLRKAKVTEPFGYVIKPFEDRELYTTIEMALYKHKIEKKLRESEERYRSFVAATSQVIWTIEPDDSPSEVMTWRDLFTKRGEKTRSRGEWLKAIHPQDQERLEHTLYTAIDKSTSFKVVFRRKSGEGDYQDVKLQGVPVLNKNGTVREWVGTCFIEDSEGSIYH